MQGFKKTGVGLAAAGLLFGLTATSASAAELIPFGLDLSVLEGANSGGTTYSGFGVSPIMFDSINGAGLRGASFVQQTISGGVGTTFTDSGILQLFAPFGLTAGSLDTAAAGLPGVGGNNGTGTNYFYFEFINLEGQATSATTIDFDILAAQGGSVRLIMDDDPGLTVGNTPGTVGFAGGGAFDSTDTKTDATAVVLAEFDVVAPSGGTNVSTDGGAFPSGVIGVSLQIATLFFPGLFVDEFGNPLAGDFLYEFVDVDASSFVIIPPGGPDGVIDIGTTNQGRLTVAVPEPGTLGLSALGLLALGFLVRRRGSVLPRA